MLVPQAIEARPSGEAEASLPALRRRLKAWEKELQLERSPLGISKEDIQSIIKLLKADIQKVIKCQ